MTPIEEECLFYANDQPVSELEVKMQSIADALPSSEWRLRLLLEDENMTIAHYRRLVNAMTMRIRSYALEEVTRTEYQWKARTEKFIFALILMFSVLVAVICFVVRHL